MLSNVSCLIPVLTFLVLDRPHDCFRCVAKDPDHIYSIFQLTREQRLLRQMDAKLTKEQQTAQVNDPNFIPYLLQKQAVTHEAHDSTEVMLQFTPGLES